MRRVLFPFALPISHAQAGFIYDISDASNNDLCTLEFADPKGLNPAPTGAVLFETSHLLSAIWSIDATTSLLSG